MLWDYIQKGDSIAYQYEQYTKDTREKKKEDKNTEKGGKGKKGDKGQSSLDYEKEKANERAHRHKLFTCIEFTPDGSELLVG